MSSTPLSEYVCAAHVHSTHSDGTGTVAEIAEQAAEAGVDIVLLTDHDTLAARRAGEERWWGDVLVVVGCEISPRGGNHYLAFGIEREFDPRGMTATEICAEVRRQGGFGFAAHPASRGVRALGPIARPMPFQALAADTADGVEVWSFVTDTVERLPGARTIPRFLADPARWLVGPRPEVVRRWDEVGRVRRFPAIGGIDAHQAGVRVGGRVVLKLMAYRRSFRYLRTHLLTDGALTGDPGEDRATVLEALRAGRSFVALDVFAPANGFRFWAERERRGEGEPPAEGASEAADERSGRRRGAGSERAEMGSEVAGRGWRLCVESPREATLRLLCDGAVRHEKHGRSLLASADAPGVWRVEARLAVDGRERTWVLTNPIYLRG